MYKQNEITSNLHALYRRMSTLGCYVYSQIEDYSYIYSSEMEWPDFVFDIDLNVFRSQEKLSGLTDKIQKNGSPSFLIFPNDKKNKEAHLLKENGYFPVMQWPGMFLSLENKTQLLEPSKFTIRKVQTEEAIQKWVKVANKNLFPNKGLKAEKIYRLLSEKEISFLEATTDGKTVGTTLTFKHGETVGIYMVSTLKEYRGMGCMKALMNDVINASLNDNVKNIVLEANNCSYIGYEKIGFEHICDFNIFWKQNLTE